MTRDPMRNEFGCPGNPDGRGCNYDLTRWIQASAPTEPGQTLVRVERCPFCEKSVLFTVDWRLELVPHEMRAIAEKGVG